MNSSSPRMNTPLPNSTEKVYNLPSDSDSSKDVSVSGRWTTEEHDRFVEAYNRYGNDWKSVSLFVKTRSMTQVRSHAQKYFARLSKTQTSKKLSLQKSFLLPIDTLGRSAEEKYQLYSMAVLTTLKERNAVLNDMEKYDNYLLTLVNKILIDSTISQEGKKEIVSWVKKEMTNRPSSYTMKLESILQQYKFEVEVANSVPYSRLQDSHGSYTMTASALLNPINMPTSSSSASPESPESSESPESPESPDNTTNNTSPSPSPSPTSTAANSINEKESPIAFPQSSSTDEVATQSNQSIVNETISGIPPADLSKPEYSSPIHNSNETQQEQSEQSEQKNMTKVVSNEVSITTSPLSPYQSIPLPLSSSIQPNRPVINLNYKARSNQVKSNSVVDEQLASPEEKEKEESVAEMENKVANYMMSLRQSQSNDISLKRSSSLTSLTSPISSKRSHTRPLESQPVLSIQSLLNTQQANRQTTQDPTTSSLRMTSSSTRPIQPPLPLCLITLSKSDLYGFASSENTKPQPIKDGVTVTVMEPFAPAPMPNTPNQTFFRVKNDHHLLSHAPVGELISTSQSKVEGFIVPVFKHKLNVPNGILLPDSSTPSFSVYLPLSSTDI